MAYALHCETHIQNGLLAVRLCFQYISLNRQNQESREKAPVTFCRERLTSRWPIPSTYTSNRGIAFLNTFFGSNLLFNSTNLPYFTP